MSARVVMRCTALVAALVAHALSAPTASSQQSPRPDPQSPSLFRSGVTAVPIDVRVLDKDGQPITGLRREDFTIIEDGVPQTIAHFSAETLAPQTPLAARTPAAGLRARPDTLAFDPTPQNYRVFLIVLGARGLGDVTRHPETLNALTDFVRHRLLPQDQVALFANNRAVDFTADHEKVARLLESFSASDAIRAGAALPRPPVDASGDAGSTVASPAALGDAPAIATELGFEDYVKSRAGEPLDELESLFFGIKYLRFMEGEKHLLFVTERGPDPTPEEATSLATAARDARVALDTIQSEVRIGDTMATIPPLPQPYKGGPELSGGNPQSSNPQSYGYDAAGAELKPPAKTKPIEQRLGTPEPNGSPLAPGESAPLTGLPAAASFGFGGIYDLRHIAAQTGGLSSMWTDAAPALARIDVATRTHYLLVYYPSNADWNGRFRSVTVRVNRPDARVVSRTGYSARREVETFDRRRVVSDSRIEAAGSQVIDIRDIDIKLTPSFAKNASGSGGEVTATISIDPSRLAWGQSEDGRHTARLDVGVYCADWNQTSVGETRRTLNLALTDETYARKMRERIARTIRLAVSGAPRFVKVIVYDYDADRVGSAMVKIK